MGSLRIFVNSPRRAFSVFMLFVFLIIWIILFIVPVPVVGSNVETVIGQGSLAFLQYFAIPLIIFLLTILIYQKDVF